MFSLAPLGTSVNIFGEKLLWVDTSSSQWFDLKDKVSYGLPGTKTKSLSDPG